MGPFPGTFLRDFLAFPGVFSMLTASALLWTRIGAGVCLFVVANLVYALLKARRQIAAGKLWARTTGKITVSRLSRPASPGKGDETATTVDVRYQYRAGDKDFEGNRIRFGGHAGMSALAADEIAAKYPLGATVDVYYDPKTPSHAALESRNKSNVAALVAFLVAFTAISAVLVAHSVAGKVLYTQNGVPLFAFMLPLFAILVAVAAFVQYVLLRRRDNASKAWPTVWGKITRGYCYGAARGKTRRRRFSNSHYHPLSPRRAIRLHGGWAGVSQQHLEVGLDLALSR
jgi:hypothetical protein